MLDRTLDYMKYRWYMLCAEVWLALQRDRDLAIAETLFHANRYAMQHKHSAQASRIYTLKNHIIAYFYQHYCSSVTISRQSFECWSCGGTGWYDTDRECWKCGGTGVYRSTLLYRFVFNIGSQSFVWHQPKALMMFPVTLTTDDVGRYDERQSQPVPGRFNPDVAIARMAAYAPEIIYHMMPSLMQAIRCDVFDLPISLRGWWSAFSFDWGYRLSHRGQSPYRDDDDEMSGL